MTVSLIAAVSRNFGSLQSFTHGRWVSRKASSCLALMRTADQEEGPEHREPAWQGQKAEELTWPTWLIKSWALLLRMDGRNGGSSRIAWKVSSWVSASNGGHPTKSSYVSTPTAQMSMPVPVNPLRATGPTLSFGVNTFNIQVMFQTTFSYLACLVKAVLLMRIISKASCVNQTLPMRAA